MIIIIMIIIIIIIINSSKRWEPWIHHPLLHIHKVCTVLMRVTCRSSSLTLQYVELPGT